MKYKFRKLNCVQETDSEDRKNDLLQKGFVLECVDGKPVKSNICKERQEAVKILEKENNSLKKTVEKLEKENNSLKKTVEKLEKENDSLKEALEKEKTDLKNVAGEVQEQEKKGKKDA